MFGPVLHVIRYRRADLPSLIDAINASGYGLTLGIHSRIDETIAFISRRAHVGNIYVNRNIVGAVVGVQPFGGEGRSGTGPKAGGPLYLKRLQREALASASGTLPWASGVLQAENAGCNKRSAWHRTRSPSEQRLADEGLDALLDWARMHGQQRVCVLTEAYMRTTLLGSTLTLPGPTGEQNTLAFAARGAILCAAADSGVLLNQLAAVLATGNRALVLARPESAMPAGLPTDVKKRIEWVASLDACKDEFQIALVEASLAASLRMPLAARSGALVSLIETSEVSLIPLWRLLAERALCVNTTAAGGNASLMTLVGH